MQPGFGHCAPFSFGSTSPMDFLISGIIAVGLLAYLAYAMFNPDKF